jgi:hypothetical protein
MTISCTQQSLMMAMIGIDSTSSQLLKKTLLMNFCQLQNWRELNLLLVS